MERKGAGGPPNLPGTLERNRIRMGWDPTPICFRSRFRGKMGSLRLIKNGQLLALPLGGGHEQTLLL